MSKKTKLIINISVLVVSISVTLTVLLLSYKELNFRNIWTFLTTGKPVYIMAAALCMLGFIVFEGLALHVIARQLGHKSKLRSSMVYSTSDIYYSAITPSASGGQPASLFYMIRDGMSAGIAGFSLMFNLMAYTAAIIIMGLFAFIARPGIFSAIDSGFAQTLVIAGFSFQALILGFFIMCLLWSRALLKVGNGLITLFAKMHIIKKPDRWRNKLACEVEKYRSCKDVIKHHPVMVFEALILNLAQRVSQTLIPCFVCLASSDAASPVDLFCMQAYVLIGYNTIPLPGGVGAYEFLYLRTYCIFFKETFILSAMMISRAFSYYVSLIVSGLYTLVYHSVSMHEKKPVPATATASGGDMADIKAGAAAEQTAGSMVPDGSAPPGGESGQDDTVKAGSAPGDTDGTEEEQVSADGEAEKSEPDGNTTDEQGGDRHEMRE